MTNQRTVTGEPQRGGNVIAQGNALGPGAETKTALKGRDGGPQCCPFRAKEADAP